MIYKINTYVDDRNIEIHERIPVDQDGTSQYTAIVMIKVNMGGEEGQQQIQANYTALDIQNAYELAEEKIKEEIKAFEEEMNKLAAEAKEEMLDQAAPQIIKPN